MKKYKKILTITMNFLLCQSAFASHGDEGDYHSSLLGKHTEAQLDTPEPKRVKQNHDTLYPQRDLESSIYQNFLHHELRSKNVIAGDFFIKELNIDYKIRDVASDLLDRGVFVGCSLDDLISDILSYITLITLPNSPMRGSETITSCIFDYSNGIYASWACHLLENLPALEDLTLCPLNFYNGPLNFAESKLKKLCLDGCEIEESTITLPSTLEEIFFDNCKITDYSFLAQVRDNLKTFGLTEDEPDENDPESLRGYERAIDTLCQLEKIEVLTLRIHISRSSMEKIQNLKHLRSLNIAGSSCDTLPAAFTQGGMPNLRSFTYDHDDVSSSSSTFEFVIDENTPMNSAFYFKDICEDSVIEKISIVDHSEGAQITLKMPIMAKPQDIILPPNTVMRKPLGIDLREMKNNDFRCFASFEQALRKNNQVLLRFKSIPSALIEYTYDETSGLYTCHHPAEVFANQMSIFLNQAKQSCEALKSSAKIKSAITPQEE